MTRSRLCLVLFAVMGLAVLPGCAGMFSKIPPESQIHTLHGMKKEAVLQKLGQPEEKKGNVWYYKKPTNNFVNNVCLWGSFGLMNGDYLPYTDVLKLEFAQNTVRSAQMMDGSINISKKGMAYITDSYGDDADNGAGRDNSRSNRYGAVGGIVQGAADSIGLGGAAAKFLSFTPDKGPDAAEPSAPAPQEKQKAAKKKTTTKTKPKKKNGK